jgi:hypothetical protein
MHNTTDYFSQAWVNKILFFLDMFQSDEFFLMLFNLILHMAEEQSQLKNINQTPYYVKLGQISFIHNQ